MIARPRLIILLAVCAAIGFSATRCTTSPDNPAQGEGTLRILVTDKPYPLDLIEEARITVTRVDVRRTVGLPVCSTHSDCADDVFCNGTETCVGEECVNGDFPCVDGEFCDEETEACMSPCTEDAQCDDASFCNGVETCDLGTGECQEGVNPCPESQICDEAGQACNNDTGEPDEDDDDSSWITIFEGEKPLNLLDLQNGQTDLLADTTIIAGTYTQTRLVVTQGLLKLKDIDEPFSLRVPSGEQTGIKLHFTFEVIADEETVLLLDVDLTRAFRPIPGGQIDDPTTIRTFHFTPSVAMTLIDIVEAGTIEGAVTDDSGTALADVIVTVFDEDGDEITSSGTSASGEFTFIGLPTGVYRLEFSLTGFEDAELTSVDVSAGTTTDVGTVMLTAIAP